MCTLRKGGANLMGLCPFHGEKSPSFSVSPTKQFYYCFGCGASGNAIGFLTAHLGMGFVDAVKELAQQVGMAVPEEDRTPATANASHALRAAARSSIAEVLRKASDHYRRELQHRRDRDRIPEGRGLSGEIAARFGLGYARAVAGAAWPEFSRTTTIRCSRKAGWSSSSTPKAAIEADAQAI